MGFQLAFGFGAQSLPSAPRRPPPQPTLPALAPQAPIAPPKREVPAVAYYYQVDGVAWLESRGSGILADDCGLGKTLQACVAADAPIVIVCPAAMRIEWARELAKWRPELTVKLLQGRTSVPPEELREHVVIVNYDILMDHVEALTKNPIATLIADEAHVLCNLQRLTDAAQKKKKTEYEGSGRALAFVRLAKHAARRFLLTATPMMNRPIELWALLHYLDPKRWHDYVAFGRYFCDGRFDKVFLKGKTKKGKQKCRRVWNFDGASNEKKLHRCLAKDYMLRRTKDVLDLPEKTRQTVHVALDEESAGTYIAAEEDFAAWVKENGGVDALKKHLAAPVVTKLTALRRIAATGKLQAAKHWAMQHLSSGRPLVVMAHHRDVTCGLVDHLSGEEIGIGAARRPVRVGSIIGGMTEKQRTENKDAFQRGELDVIVCSIAAAGVGLTLTAASDVLFVERIWRPSDQIQAEDRVHRIGQKNQVSITYLDAAGTIDEALGKLLLDKRSTFASVIDGDDLSEAEAIGHVFGYITGLQRRQSLRQRVLGMW